MHGTAQAAILILHRRYTFMSDLRQSDVWQAPAVNNFTSQAFENCSHTNGSAATEDHREPVSNP